MTQMETAQLAKLWLSLDPNPETRQEIQDLLAKSEWAALADRLNTRLTFGTAGLRGQMGAGFSRLNSVTIQQTTQGLVMYLLDNFQSDILARGFVIGHDHRHHSAHFAQVTRLVFQQKGIPVYLFKDLIATPLLAFAVKRLRCFCGVMITASHNPKSDNGYKLYWSNGVQLVSPHDELILKSIERHGEALWDLSAVQDHAKAIDDSIIPQYLEEISKLRYTKEADFLKKIVYTPMHGVGNAIVRKVMKSIGFPPFIETDSQAQPDPDFPTVKFPNPEEQGAFDEAMKVAERTDASIILSNDPDADRLAVAERQADGNWQIFTGDEIGYLLAYYLSTTHFKGSTKTLAYISSYVSSPFLKHMVQYLQKMYPDRRFAAFQDLTGFKFLANKAAALESLGTYDVVLAYEEALGYMVGTTVLDKDGLSSLAIMADLIYSLPSGTSLSAYLRELYAKVGYVASDNSYFKCSTSLEIPRIFHRLRTGKIPTSNDSLSLGPIDGGSHLPPLSSPLIHIKDYGPSKMMTFSFKNGVTITFRASGTEPKLKFYSYMGCITIKSDPENFNKIKGTADQQVHAFVTEIIQKWIYPEAFNIELA